MVAPEWLKVEDGGARGACGQWAFPAPGLHLQSRVCQHVRLLAKVPKRVRELSPWAFAVGLGVGLEGWTGGIRKRRKYWAGRNLQQ